MLDFTTSSPAEITLAPGYADSKECQSVNFNFAGLFPADEDHVYYTVYN